MSKIDQPKIPMGIVDTFVPNGVKVKLTKIGERIDAEVPNNIPVNDYRIGYIRESLLKPIIGVRYGLESVIEINGKTTHPGHYFITSEVVDIPMNSWDFNNPDKWIGCTIKTLNSIYKLEVL
jgi:hypothetical protein